MSSRILQINLWPRDSYFAGSTRFSELGNKRDYHLKSARYPQQSALLGMLRYELLLQNGRLQDKNKFVIDKALAGSKGYGSPGPFGIIQKLSPLFIAQDNVLYRYSKFEYCSIKKGEKKPKPMLAEFGQASSKNLLKNQAVQQAVFLKEYIEKERTFECLIAAINSADPVAAKEIFHEISREHTNKKQGNAQEQGYWVRERNRLSPSYCFSFFVEFNENTEYIFKNNEVMLGGAHSRFNMEIAGEWDSWTAYQQQLNTWKGESNKIVLLSPAQMKTDYLQYCEAVQGGTLVFRNVKTRKPNSSVGGKPAFSQHQLFLDRGTILHLKDGIVPTILFANSNINTVVGHNQYIQLK